MWVCSLTEYWFILKPMLSRLSSFVWWGCLILKPMLSVLCSGKWHVLTLNVLEYNYIIPRSLIVCIIYSMCVIISFRSPTPLWFQFFFFFFFFFSSPPPPPPPPFQSWFYKTDHIRFRREKEKMGPLKNKFKTKEDICGQSSGAVWKSRWPSWAPVPNKPTVSVDVKQHSDCGD